MSEHKAEVDIKPQMSNIVVSFINNLLELAKRTFLENHPLAKVKDQADRIRRLSRGRRAWCTRSRLSPRTWRFLASRGFRSSRPRGR